MRYDLLPGDEDPVLTFIHRCLKNRLTPSPLTDPLVEFTAPKFQWDRFIQIAHQENIAPLLHSILKSHSWVPTIIANQLYQAYRESSIRNTFLFSELSKIISALCIENIPHILLKGSGLAILIYDDIGLRPMVDIDLLVSQEDVHKLIQALAPLGYSLTKADSHVHHLLRFENEIMLTKPGLLNVLLEVHWAMFDSPYYQTIIPSEWLWQSARRYYFEEKEILLPGHTAQILHLCGHLYLHHTGEEILWQYDIAAWMDKFRTQISWDEVLSLAQAFSLVQPIKVLIPKICRDYGAMISPDVLERIENLVVSPNERTIIHDLKASQDSVVQHFWFDLKVIKGWKLKFIFIWQNLFPSIDYMKYRYNIEHSYLLPALYIYRWALGIKDLFRFRARRNG